jgi:hypothetical protein
MNIRERLETARRGIEKEMMETSRVREQLIRKISKPYFKDNVCEES